LNTPASQQAGKRALRNARFRSSSMLDLFPLLAACALCLCLPVCTLAGMVIGYRRIGL
jgi:hypothetical protein